MSQDPVAIDSVGLDFLRAKFPFDRSKDRDFQPMKNADNFPRGDALAGDPPSGVRYAPDGLPPKSLGVHEHRNNEVDRQCSLNLGNSQGIELFAVPPR